MRIASYLLFAGWPGSILARMERGLGMAIIIFPGGVVSELASEGVALGILEKGAYRFTYTKHHPSFPGVPVFTIV